MADDRDRAAGHRAHLPGPHAGAGQAPLTGLPDRPQDPAGRGAGRSGSRVCPGRPRPHLPVLGSGRSRDALRGPRTLTDAERAACTEARERPEWEALDEISVAGRDYRVLRAEQVLRPGPDGIEPPRPTDPDPAAVGEGYRLPSRVEGFVIGPAAGVTPVDGILRLDLTALVPAGRFVPEDVRDGARLASHLHPEVMVLPAHCAVAEFRDGRGGPMTGACETPQGARDCLAACLREFAPRLDPHFGEEEPARYAEAADRLDTGRADEVRVAGRRFRPVRVEPVVRLGPDGPELPRTSDRDPDEPLRVQEQRDRAAGIVHGEDGDEGENADDTDEGADDIGGNGGTGAGRAEGG
ncbi:DUF5954 family protein [Kitasatospora sp. NPDC059463]|uniref:DUF5954 family protein n=1 Tax=unclassified Kitasatospora TaxID=2633591 RepID=UPI0036CE2C35